MESKIAFYKKRIRQVLDGIQEDIGEARYRLYIDTVDQCNNIRELQEMADLELQTQFIQYTREIKRRAEQRGLAVEGILEEPSSLLDEVKEEPVQDAEKRLITFDYSDSADEDEFYDEENLEATASYLRALQKVQVDKDVSSGGEYNVEKDKTEGGNDYNRDRSKDSEGTDEAWEEEIADYIEDEQGEDTEDDEDWECIDVEDLEYLDEDEYYIESNDTVEQEEDADDEDWEYIDADDIEELDEDEYYIEDATVEQEEDADDEDWEYIDADEIEHLDEDEYYIEGDNTNEEVINFGDGAVTTVGNGSIQKMDRQIFKDPLTQKLFSTAVKAVGALGDMDKD